jgi:branched-chain amino acid transport system substrate-binding protein
MSARKLSISVLMVIIVVFAFAASVLAAPKESGEIVIGALYPLTGSLAIQGTLAFNGADIAREIVNEKGGVWGKKVVFEKVDAPDPAAATSQAERLINQKKVKLVIGSYSSSISIAASAVCERNKVVWAEQGGMSVNVTNRGFKYTFRATPNTDQVGIGAAGLLETQIALALGMKPSDMKVAVIHEDSAFGTGVADAFIKRAGELGLKVVVKEPYSAKSTDLAPLVLKLKGAAPDVILATQYLNDEILFWKQTKELDLNVKAFIGSGGTVGMTDYRQAVGATAEGVLEVDGPSTDIKDKLDPRQRVLVDEFLKRFKARTGTDQPPSPATNGFLSTSLLLTDVLPKAGSMDPDKIRNAYLGLDIPAGKTPMGFGVKFGQDGQNQRTFMIVRQWQGDKFVVVAPSEWATAKICCVPLKPWSQR